MQRAKPFRGRIVGGWVFLDGENLVGGARVRVLDGRGRPLKLLPGSTFRTGPDGTFLVALRSLPKRFTVTASGGRANAEPFRGTLAETVWGGNQTLYVSPASTLAAAYLRGHPTRTVADGIARAKHTLAIPDEATLRSDLRFSDTYFAAEPFLDRARESGGVGRLVTQLLRTADAGNQLSFAGDPNPNPTPKTVEFGDWLTDKLADGAVSYVGGLAMGWVLGQIGIQSGADAQLAEIAAKLDEINARLTVIGQQLSALIKQANEQYLATIATSLSSARSLIESRQEDVQWVAQTALAPHDEKYLELETCRKLKALYPLASGTLDYGYPTKLIQDAFFPQSTGLKPLAEAEALVVRDRSRFWTQTSRDSTASLAGFWALLEANFLQLKLEWEHSVSPCPTTPTPTPANCESLRWAATVSSLMDAQLDTVPPPVGDTWLDRNTGFMWGPTTIPPAGLLPHPVPTDAFSTFFPFTQWIGGQQPADACRALPGNSGGRVKDPRGISLCAIDLAPPGTAGPFEPYRDWLPPSLSEYGVLFSDYASRGFSTPREELIAPPETGGMGVDLSWLIAGSHALWLYPCESNYPYIDCLWFNVVTNHWGGFFRVDTSLPNPDYHGHVTAGFFVRRAEARPERFWTAQLTGGPVRYVSGNGTDAGNDCNAFSRPCKTLAQALDQAKPGDVIRLVGTLPATGGVTVSKSVTIAGAGARLTTISGGAPVIRIAAGTSVRIQGVTITGGSVIAADTGGGIDNAGTLTLVDSSVTGNRAPDGGGIHNGNGATMTILRSTVSGNSGDLIGGIENRASDFSAPPATLRVIDTTISANTGGGLLTAPGNLATLYNVTITGNTPSARNPYAALGGAPVTMTNTVVAANPGLPDCRGSVAAGPQGHNLIGNLGDACDFAAGGSAGNQVGTQASPIDAKLGALDDNGGPTKTVKPLEGSPAIGAGSPSACADRATVAGLDQRGYVRPAGSCDVGAFDTKATAEVP